MSGVTKEAKFKGGQVVIFSKVGKIVTATWDVVQEEWKYMMEIGDNNVGYIYESQLIEAEEEEMRVK